MQPQFSRLEFNMDSKYEPNLYETKLYEFWEKAGFFEGGVKKGKKSFSIILPPPNANADLHLGHAMYVYEDIMIRYKKLSGFETLWLPGGDHAGFETQFVFEKELKKQSKSRMDFDRETLYKMIWDFVIKNKGNMENQLRRLGFALDWEKNKFTLDPEIIKIVYKTFKKLYDKGLIYRDKRLINYCTHCGTSFSDLEVKDLEVEAQKGLYFIDYEIIGGSFVTVATTRPETMFADVALMVNPKDKKNKELIGKVALIPLTKREIPIIADLYVDPKFGTGIVKVTPAHDFNDFEIAKKHKLPSFFPVIGFDGKIQNTKTEYDGKKVVEVRLLIETQLKAFRKVIKHSLVLKTCYKCGKTLEPLPLEQWFVKVKPLAQKGLEAISQNKIKFHPQKYKKLALDWLTNFHDWNISRQIVWGIGIPAWQCEKCNEWIITEGDKPEQCAKCPGRILKQDPDTFDTWFSSAQWPYATLQTAGEDFFKYFYPTSVMETGYDILPWWVCRMIMMGIYATGTVPFKLVYLHGLVRDKKGQKMSKSRGNVINPMIMIDKYGVDALRASLIFEVGLGSDISFTEEKVIGMRNFANKIWNVGRFILMNRQIQSSKFNPDSIGVKVQNHNSKLKILDALKKEFLDVKKSVLKNMEEHRFSQAFGDLYEFLWHRFADFYIEELKKEAQSGNIEVLKGLEKVYLEILVLIHPFMPFITEAIWKQFNGEKTSILDNRIN